LADSGIPKGINLLLPQCERNSVGHFPGTAAKFPGEIAAARKFLIAACRSSPGQLTYQLLHFPIERDQLSFMALFLQCRNRSLWPLVKSLDAESMGHDLFTDGDEARSHRYFLGWSHVRKRLTLCKDFKQRPWDLSLIYLWDNLPWNFFLSGKRGLRWKKLFKHPRAEL
jgi:hypothetical protein